MKKVYFLCVLLCICWTVIYAEKPAKSDCLEREKALTLLETAEDLLSKANNSFPSCKKVSNSTDDSGCDNEKSLAYIQVSRKLISDVRENFPTCLKDNQQYDRSRDCSEVLTMGNKESGVYTIWPSESFTDGKPLRVYCDMKTEEGGWTMIQRRGKYTVQLDFNKDWESYKNGFGNLKEEFWLGNENIQVLCHKGCKIRFDLQAKNGTKIYAVYRSFILTGSNYQIHIANYTGNAGDAMMFHNEYVFSTKDKDISGKAKEYQSGWWHGGRYHSNLNGIYQPANSGPQFVYWYPLHKNYENLASVEMKVRPN